MPGISRRAFVEGSLALPALGALDGLTPRPRNGPRVVVVGAGAFGGWAALHLLRRGARVTLVDAWGAGHARASSGGETRVIRGLYGADRVYVELVARSFALWQESELAWGRRLYHPTGALWMFRGDDRYARTSLPLANELGLPARELPLVDARRRYPAVNFDGVRSVFMEERAGYLAARQACEAVREALVREGGEWRQAMVRTPAPIPGKTLRAVTLADGSALTTDHAVFACGPWLGALFPEQIGDAITPTRQEVFYFGTPPGDERYEEGHFPVWIDFGERIFYGIPGNERRGFKVADDTRGAVVDPTSLERMPSPEGVARARALITERFPALAGAPLLGAEVCQYENSPDGHLVVDRLPGVENVWIVGGGSGHGFKLGPALGEHVAGLVLGTAAPIALFGFARLAALRGAGQRRQMRGDEGESGGTAPAG
jgi:glycine/D-amino acid oxidase-like deaminating enzyme